MAEKDDLHSACYNQDTQLVKQLLVGIKPTALNRKLADYANPIQGAPLHVATKNGNLEIVKLLVEAGADVEQKNIERLSPLSIAISNRHLEVVDYLLSAGADIHSKGPNNLEPIHFACSLSTKPIIELLLSKGIDINTVDSLKSSLLDFTTNLDGGNLEAAKTLVENGIDPKFFTTAFRWACWRNNPTIAKYLLECGADYTGETTPKSELLFWVCGLGHKEIVQLLLDLNVDLKTKVRFRGKMMAYDGSPLDRAIANNQAEVVALIQAS